ncbi:MAG: TipC family immunity protein [Bacillus sp. (in: Bacteria)]|nr:TipC family immunity protein [Bacillus sp. (in: firmicutes)]MCM1427075.1 TipC family immunity protein [Eubacterium sp.]
MRNKFLKIVMWILCIHFIISCFTPNVMRQIGKWKVYGTNTVLAIERESRPWEWMDGLDLMGALGVRYKEKYLREDVSFIDLGFFRNTNDVDIGILVILSESDKVRMKLDMYYDYEEKKLIYKPVYILQGESGYSEIYKDEKSIDEFLSKYGLTRRDVKKYQKYAVYNVVVRTWTRAHLEWYWLESWKLKLCKVEDNTFRFEEE